MSNTEQPVARDPDLFDVAGGLGFGDIHFKVDHASGLRAIIAIHNTRLGPALGGCRCVPYPSTDDALLDALRLARAMSYKAAMAGLASGGGKAVVMRPAHMEDREALFEAFGGFVDELGGRFITSVDSGTGVADMDAIAHRTRHVRSTSATGGGSGDPSPTTALGVRRGIEAAVRSRMGRDSLEGVHVAIQGIGHVGHPLARELHAQGARLTVCNRSPEPAQRCADEFGARIVAIDEIYTAEADVFAPCALGGVINDKTVHKLAARIVAGAANNPLADTRHAVMMHQKGILYAPDYVINAGGLMQVLIRDEATLREKVEGIYATLLRIFEQAARHEESPLLIANRMAEEILYGPRAE